MENSEIHFNHIKTLFTDYPGVTEENMMSSLGLKVNNKVFTFFHKEQMGFRLGPQFDLEKMGVQQAKPLSPFKTKPALKGWYLIGKNESDLWEPLTEMALEFTKTLK